MFDKLVDLVLSSLQLLQFWQVVPAYERGVVLRLGRFSREIGPGFHFLLPFFVERYLGTSVVEDTMLVGPQSLTTKDQEPLLISYVITFRVKDVQKFLLGVEGAEQVLGESSYGVVSDLSRKNTFTELLEMNLSSKMTVAIRRTAERCGVDVDKVQIRDFISTRTFRLIQ